MVFNILGLERNENRHSAFIAWLLNPAESHQLGENPLKHFLALLATHTYDALGNSDECKCYYETSASLPPIPIKNYSILAIEASESEKLEQLPAFYVTPKTTY